MATNLAQSLEERLDRLERQNHNFTRVAAAAPLLAAVILTLGQCGQSTNSSRTVDARRIVLRDSNGRVRATLEIEAGGPALRLFDTNGKQRVSVDAVGDTPGFEIDDDAGEDLFNLMVRDDDKAPEFNLHDNKGNLRVRLSASEDSADLALFSGPNTVPRIPMPQAELSAEPIGATLSFLDDHGKVVRQLGR